LVFHSSTNANLNLYSNATVKISQYRPGQDRKIPGCRDPQVQEVGKVFGTMHRTLPPKVLGFC